LNKRLSKIHESEILIHTDMKALFLNGQVDNNRWSRADERTFLQEFLEFYNAEILKEGETFHYETFYDFYSEYLHTRNGNKAAIEGFFQAFDKRHFTMDRPNLRDCYNRVSDFNRSFNQLLASQLHKRKYFENVSMLNYPLYDSFVSLMRELLKFADIKFHTLNHDLFFDWLGTYHESLGGHFCDGFQLGGSPYYGTVTNDIGKGNDTLHKSYYVKLEQFVDKWDKPLALYKLHGSISNTLVYRDNNWVRIKDNFAISRFLMEVKDGDSGSFKFTDLNDEVSPDFLSGTTNKTRYYTGDPYYQTLFNHFEENLSNSELLVVIGYGFQDEGINKFLVERYLEYGKQMVVIDPDKPKTELLDKYKAIFIPKGVTELSYQEYIVLIPENLKG